MQWFRYYHEALDDPKVQRLPADEFRRLFYATIDGEETVFSRYLKGPYTRPDPNEWRVLRAAVFERDDYTCQYCGARGGRMECDHKNPVSRGGTHEMDNLATACFSCNRSKRAKTAEEFMGTL